MVDAAFMRPNGHSEDEQDSSGVLAAGDTLSLDFIIGSVQMTIESMEFSEYEDFMDDLQMIESSGAELSRELGLGKNTVYSWKRWGVPTYAKAYLDVKTQLTDFKLRYRKI